VAQPETKSVRMTKDRRIIFPIIISNVIL